MKLAAAFLAFAIAPMAVAQQAHHEGRYGNPDDLESYVAHLEDPARDAWQKPAEVVKALGLKPGQTACDIGSGPGYFTLRLAREVGATGRVYAVDVEPVIIGALRDRIEKAGIRNVTPVLAVADDPLLPDALCDVILIVDTYHHFPDGPAYLKRLSRSLAPGGTIANVDYVKRETPIGPPLAHRLSREQFLSDAGKAGLAVVSEPTLLEYQYFIVLKPRPN